MTFATQGKMGKLYGIDGDKVGALIDAYFIRSEIHAIEEFSAKVAFAMEEIQKEVVQASGTIVFCAGDSILFWGDFEHSWCEKLLNIFLRITERTASMGVGNSATEAYLGLKLAKADGGGKIVHYSVPGR